MKKQLRFQLMKIKIFIIVLVAFFNADEFGISSHAVPSFGTCCLLFGGGGAGGRSWDKDEGDWWHGRHIMDSSVPLGQLH